MCLLIIVLNQLSQFSLPLISNFVVVRTSCFKCCNPTFNHHLLVFKRHNNLFTSFYNFVGAPDQSRTGTLLGISHRILNSVCLPIPPQGHTLLYTPIYNNLAILIFI